MTDLEQARAAFDQAHHDFLPIARERARAQARFLAAEDAFAEGMPVLDAAFEDYLAILDAEEDAAAVAEQPAF